MCKRMLCLMCLVLFLGQAEWALGADPNLMGLWRLDEGSGSIARDSSGHGNDGTFNGDPQWVEGYYGSALEFDGAGDYLDCGSDPSLDLTKWTIAFWLNLNENKNYNGYIVKGVDAAENYEVLTYGAGNFHFPVLFEGGARGFSNTANGISIVGEWAHYTYTYDPAQGRRFYKDGGLIFEDTESRIPQASTSPLLIGNEGGTSRFVPGIMDDIGIFNYAMTEQEIRQIMQGYTPAELAVNVYPENEQIDAPRNSILEWGSGKFANTHNVYFGTELEDVNNASTADGLGVLVSEGQTENSYDPGILDFDQVYYWRVDEVNGAPDRTVFKGQVWSFTAEPYSIPVEMITATASSSNTANMGPENTIGGVGLNELDQHSTEATEMWLSGMGDPTPSIQYEFDQPYKLHEMWVWNSNQLIESFLGIGAKDVVIEHSLDGTEWVALGDVQQFAQAPGSPTYTANTAVDFGGALAQFVRITINNGWGMLPQYGLSEVRFYYIPTFPREAQPADGELTAGANVLLSWRAGREAVSHQVSLGTDAADLPLVGTTSDSSYAADALNYGTTYYWQITEVNDSETPAAYAGPIWSFTTPDFGTVDDFEGYDDDCKRIFFAWLDGIGHNGAEECGIAPYNGNGTGSIVGNNVAPFAERDIVHGGNQAMPFLYDSGMSEATLSLTSQDWTASGVQTLSLYFHGVAGNTGQLYIKINGTKVVYNGAAADITSGPWKPWNIDLATVGGNLQNVTGLTIGVENASGPGTLYIDDILLYPQAVEFVTPVEPDAGSLLAHYAFDGDFSDSAGNFDGTALGNAQIVSDPARGQVLSLDGDDDAVDIPGMGESAEITLSVWVNVADVTTPSDWKSTFHGDAWTAGDVHWRILNNRVNGGINGVSGGDLTGAADIPYEQWNHVALTMSPTEFAYWVNGHVDVTRTLDTAPMLQMGDGLIGAWLNGQNVEREFAGLIDDFRIYNRALTQAELLWLAGQTDPVAKPF